jgi:3-deoxy-D-manno-octulosonate cytidylyltransferase
MPRAIVWWCHSGLQKQPTRHSERSEESLRFPTTRNQEGFLASLGMTNERSCAQSDPGQITPRLAIATNGAGPRLVVASGIFQRAYGQLARGKTFMAIAVIPARYAATRLPGKPLVSLAGKSMIERVWERARQAKTISRVIIATDDDRILKAAAAFGAEAAMTRSEHRSGTERVAEVAAGMARGSEEIFVNVQGDEPLIEPGAIDAAVEAIESEESVQVSTLMVPIAKPADIMDPNIVKVVLDFDGNALYFSRAPIPWVRVSQRGVAGFPDAAAGGPGTH